MILIVIRVDKSWNRLNGKGFYKVEHNANDWIARHNVRLVTKGSAHKYGSHYKETFSLDRIYDVNN
jgi:hypothetical protein